MTCAMKLDYMGEEVRDLHGKITKIQHQTKTIRATTEVSPSNGQ